MTRGGATNGAARSIRGGRTPPPREGGHFRRRKNDRRRHPPAVGGPHESPRRVRRAGYRGRDNSGEACTPADPTVANIGTHDRRRRHFSRPNISGAGGKGHRQTRRKKTRTSSPSRKKARRPAGEAPGGRGGSNVPASPGKTRASRTSRGACTAAAQRARGHGDWQRHGDRRRRRTRLDLVPTQADNDGGRAKLRYLTLILMSHVSELDLLPPPRPPLVPPHLPPFLFPFFWACYKALSPARYKSQYLTSPTDRSE